MRARQRGGPDQVPVARRDRGPQPGLQPLFGRDLAHLGILGEQGRPRPPADRARRRACAPAKRLIRKSGGSRSAPLLTLLYALTVARWSRHPVPAARRFQRASSDRGRSRLLSRGYRWFESVSLRHYKGFMLAITISYLNGRWANPQADPQQFCRCRWTSLDHLGRSRYSPPVVNTSAHRNHCLSSM
jgi:hypothetical protein